MSIECYRSECKHHNIIEPFCDEIECHYQRRKLDKIIRIAKLFFMRLKAKLSGMWGECDGDGDYVCPSYKTQWSYDDINEYCFLGNLECWKCKYKFLPDFLIKLLSKYVEYKNKKEFEKL